MRKDKKKFVGLRRQDRFSEDFGTRMRARRKFKTIPSQQGPASSLFIILGIFLFLLIIIAFIIWNFLF